MESSGSYILQTWANEIKGYSGVTSFVIFNAVVLPLEGQSDETTCDLAEKLGTKSQNAGPKENRRMDEIRIVTVVECEI